MHDYTGFTPSPMGLVAGAGDFLPIEIWDLWRPLSAGAVMAGSELEGHSILIVEDELQVAIPGAATQIVGS